MTIRIPCNKSWFQLIKKGEYDLRPITPYWTKRLEGKEFDTITFTMGYPKADDADRHYVIPFRGFLKYNGMYVIFTTEKHKTYYEKQKQRVHTT